MDKQDVIDYLVYNKEMIQELVEPFDQMKKLIEDTTPKELWDDVKQEYDWEVKGLILELITRNTGLDAESIIIVLEDIDLREYLK